MARESGGDWKEELLTSLRKLNAELRVRNQQEWERTSRKSLWFWFLAFISFSRNTPLWETREVWLIRRFFTWAKETLGGRSGALRQGRRIDLRRNRPTRNTAPREVNLSSRTRSTSIAPGEQESLPRTRSTTSNGADLLFQLLALVAITYVGFKGLQKTYSFLKELDWGSLTPEAKQALARFEADAVRFQNQRARLERAEQLLLQGDKISVEAAAMLTSAVLESGLKHLQERHAVLLREDEEGMVGVAIALHNASVISPLECSEIKKHGWTVRNLAMHGDFDSIEQADVEQEFRFTREFFQTHQLA